MFLCSTCKSSRSGGVWVDTKELLLLRKLSIILLTLFLSQPSRKCSNSSKPCDPARPLYNTNLKNSYKSPNTSANACQTAKSTLPFARSSPSSTKIRLFTALNKASWSNVCSACFRNTNLFKKKISNLAEELSTTIWHITAMLALLLRCTLISLRTCRWRQKSAERLWLTREQWKLWKALQCKGKYCGSMWFSGWALRTNLQEICRGSLEGRNLSKVEVTKAAIIWTRCDRLLTRRQTTNRFFTVTFLSQECSSSQILFSTSTTSPFLMTKTLLFLHNSPNSNP